jgi:hypothetical protein
MTSGRATICMERAERPMGRAKFRLLLPALV